MDWLYSLFVGGGIAHTVFTLALVITAGILLGKVKVCGISLGITWILFVGIIAAHFGMGIPAEVRHFIQEFGLILFVFSIGMQVGPGFFASFKHGGLTLVCLASTIVLLGVGVAYVIHLVSGTPIPTMVGILSGAVTNTPGLGAAQQAYADASGVEDPSIALGYAVAYPLGVIGIIFSMIFIRYALRVKFGKEDEALAAISAEHKMAEIVSIECTNKMLSGHDISYVNELINRKFVISRIAHPDGTIVLADSNSIISLGDKVLVVCASEDCEAVTAFIGNRIEMGEKEWDTPDSKLVSRRILITKPEINGKTFADLRLRTRYGINITRVNRAGVDLIPYQGMQLQIGDRVMVVGPENAIEKVAAVLGNSLKKLREPNLVTIFVGIALGVLLGSIPLLNVPQPVKLGLAGGPLIVALLLGRFGPRFHLVTYTTMSANLMLREVGIALFLAAVDLVGSERLVGGVHHADLHPVRTRRGGRIGKPAAVLREGHVGQGHRPVVGELIGVEEHLAGLARLLRAVDHRLVLQTVVISVVPPVAVLARGALLGVVPHFGQPLADGPAERNLREVVLRHGVLGGDPRGRGLRVVVLEPAVGIGNLRAEIVVHHVAAHGLGVRLMFYLFHIAAACRRRCAEQKGGLDE